MGNKSIGALLRELRRKRNLTIEQLGEKAGVDASVISRAETGKRAPTGDTLIKLAGPLGVDLKDLAKQAGKI